MKECPLFKPQVVVIPDTRWLDTDPKPGMERCVKELRRLCGEGFVSMVEQDELGLWPDVLEDAAVVCYPSPYDVSAFRYNPHYSVGRDFLPVGVNYGFYRYQYLIMYIAVLLLVILVQLFQSAGTKAAVKSDKRLK